MTFRRARIHKNQDQTTSAKPKIPENAKKMNPDLVNHMRYVLFRILFAAVSALTDFLCCAVYLIFYGWFWGYVIAIESVYLTCQISRYFVAIFCHFVAIFCHFLTIF